MNPTQRVFDLSGNGGRPAASSERLRRSPFARAASASATATAAGRRRHADETNVRRLALYVCGGRKYEQAVRYVRKMTKHHGRGNIVNFLKYVAKYLRRSVRDDDVAKFRAVRMIEKCYGSFVVWYPRTAAGASTAPPGHGEQRRDPSAHHRRPA